MINERCDSLYTEGSKYLCGLRILVSAHEEVSGYDSCIFCSPTGVTSLYWLLMISYTLLVIFFVVVKCNTFFNTYSTTCIYAVTETSYTHQWISTPDVL